MKTITFDTFFCQDALDAKKLTDFYEGDQTKYLCRDLDTLRSDWKGKKAPRTRNVTKSIVDKSGLLFNQPPNFEIIPGQGEAPVNDETFDALMERSHWLEFFQNIDVYSRLLKSIVILQQKYVATETSTVNGKYVPNFDNGDEIILEFLTRAQCDVVLDKTGTRIIELAYLTSNIDANGGFTYRVITDDEISDWEVKNQEEKLIAAKTNPDGLVPGTMVYDVNRPRRGAWVKPPEDIIHMQEMYNLGLTDTEYAIAHQKSKTLFTNATELKSSRSNGPGASLNIPHAEEGFTPAGTAYPSMGFSSTDMGGLGKVVTLSTGDPSVLPFVEFKGPESDLMDLNATMDTIVRGVAYDWNVSMRMEGTGKANSGFQIITEEIDNLQLRSKRMQSMQSALRRFYIVTQRLYPTLTAGTLRVRFAPPSLPINTSDNEKLWSTKISEGRGSVIDYFREVQGLSEVEAVEKAREVKAYNDEFGVPIIPPSQNAGATSPDAVGNVVGSK